MNRLILIAVICFPMLLVAEEAPEIPPPTQPLLRRMPAASEWTVTIRRDREKAGKEMQEGKGEGEQSEVDPEERVPESKLLEPMKIQVTKHGDLIRETTLWSNRKATEKWIFGQLQLREDEINNDVSRVMTPRSFYSPDYSDYSNSDFEECEWIRMNSYKGVQRIKGRAYYVFETSENARPLTNREKAEKILTEKEGKSAPSGSTTRKFVVYLDVTRQVPVYSDNGTEIRLYEYSERAPDPLVPPQRFSDALAEWRTEIAQRTRVPTPP